MWFMVTLLQSYTRVKEWTKLFKWGRQTFGYDLRSALYNDFFFSIYSIFGKKSFCDPLCFEPWDGPEVNPMIPIERALKITPWPLN